VNARLVAANSFHVLARPESAKAQKWIEFAPSVSACHAWSRWWAQRSGTRAGTPAQHGSIVRVGVRRLRTYGAGRQEGKGSVARWRFVARTGARARARGLEI
jgi:hypothetical protein